ncbi:hypothetical protein [Helicobacter sp. MIT 05-5294]|nr:hypothetical protein [Helicobacter sp. MIT 05-5294]
MTRFYVMDCFVLVVLAMTAGWNCNVLLRHCEDSAIVESWQSII